MWKHSCWLERSQEYFEEIDNHLATEVLEKAESINDYSTWLASSTMTSGRHNGQREHQYKTHDMPHCRSMLGFMHETCPRLPLRLFAPNPPNSLHPVWPHAAIVRQHPSRPIPACIQDQSTLPPITSTRPMLISMATIQLDNIITNSGDI